MTGYRHAAELIIGAAVGAVLTIATIVYVGRVVGPEEYADYSAALSVIYFVALVFAPVTPTVARLIAQRAARDDLAGAMAIRALVMKRLLIVSAIALAAGMALVPFASQWLKFRSPFTLLFALVASLLYALLSVDRGLLQGLTRFREYNANAVAEAAVRAVATVALLAFVANAASATFCYALALAAAQAMIVLRIRPSRREDVVEWPAVVRLAVPMMLMMMAIAIFQNTDVLAVKRWFSPGHSGLYGAAGALNRGFGVIFAPLYVMAGPMLTRRHEAGQTVFKPTLGLAAAFLAMTTAPLLVFMVWPRLIVTALYGPVYAPAASLLAPLAGVTIMTYAAIMLAQALITIGDFSFLRGFVVCAAIQVIGLIIVHRDFSDVFAVLYFAQTILLIVTSMYFLRASRKRVC